MARNSRAGSPVRQNVYAAVADELDLRAALSTGLERNDLLPSRPDDRAGGEVAERFIAALEALVARGRYEADRSLLVPVAKANYATALRPCSPPPIGSCTTR